MRSIAAYLVVVTLLCAVASESSGSIRASQATIYTGYGFDTCAAPSLATLNAWLASPYRAVGIYVGGANRTCPDGNLSASWVTAAEAAGWSLAPLYVGRQAPCVAQPRLARIDPASAASEGAQAAVDASARAASYGLAGGPIYYDMEGYSTTNPACTLVVQTFLSAWVGELHARGYIAGVYGSAASTIRDLAALTVVPGSSVPDDVWIANWNGQQAVFGDPYVSDNLWPDHQRLHQYRGGHKETYGGVTLTIDSDYLDGVVIAAITTVPPPPPSSPPSSGSVVSSDGQVSVGWPSNAFAAAANVTLAPSPPVPPPNGYAPNAYVLQLTASDAATGTSIARFDAPLTLHFNTTPAGAVPELSTDGAATWTRLNNIGTAPLPASVNAAYAVEPGGLLDITTVVPGLFGLFQDIEAPTPPRGLHGRVVSGALRMRWHAARDNSGSVASYLITLNGKPVLTLSGTAQQTQVSWFYPSAPSVYRLLAVDAAGNTSKPTSALVVVPARRPSVVPHTLPSWARNLYQWEKNKRVTHRPQSPLPLPKWYWDWLNWRQHPFRVVSG
jgi:Domain of unknown function (DUF1906)